MDNCNFTNGTLFDNIIKINKKMTELMNVRVDLRKANMVQAEEGQQEEDNLKAQEDKLDMYIVKFINLNVDNQQILKKA